MEDNFSLIENLKKYYRYQAELSTRDNAFESFCKTTEEETYKRFDELNTAIRSFCGKEQFRTFLKKVCLSYPEIVNFENGYLYFQGKLPPMPVFTAQSVEEVAKESMTEITSCAKLLASGQGDVPALLKLFSTDYFTLRCICERLQELYLQAVQFKKDEYQKTSQTLKEKQALLIGKNNGLFEKMQKDEDAFFEELSKTANGACERAKNLLLRLEQEEQKELKNKIPVAIERVQDPALFGGKPLDTLFYLSENKGESALFIEFEKGVEVTKSGKIFERVQRLVYSAMAEFPVGNLQFSFIESNNVPQILAPIYKGIEDISSDYLFRPMAKEKRSVQELLNDILSEMTERQTCFLSNRKKDGTPCKTIGEYNAMHKDTPLPYLLFAVNGYPDLFADEEKQSLLTKIISFGGDFGVLTVVFGKNTPVKSVYGETFRLSFDDLAMRCITVEEGGHVRFEGRDLDVTSIASDGQIDEYKHAFESRARRMQLFFTESILEEKSARPFEEEISIPVGTAGGKLFSLRSATEKPPYPFTLITGDTGSGKSAFLHSLIMSGAMKYSPDELQFHIIDFKTDTDSQEFKDYAYKKGERNAYIPHVKYLSLRSKSENALDVIAYIKNLMNERNRLGKFEEYNKREDVKSGKVPPMPMIYVIIDEYEHMLSGGDKPNSYSDIDMALLGPRITEGVTTILKRARTFGIGVIFSGQAIKLSTDAMNQISNRIAFHNGRGVFENTFLNWKDRMIEKFPEREYRGYAYCAENASAIPEFVRMAYVGDKNKLFDLAEKIRKKYGERVCDQVIVGDMSASKIDSAHPYNTWSEEVDYRLSLRKTESDDEESLLQDKKSYQKSRPLAIGISGAGQLPVALEYSKGANGFNYFACANDGVLGRIQTNAALAFLYQTATLPYRRPRILYLSAKDEEESFSKRFGPYLRDYPFLREHIECVHGERACAGKLIELAKKLNEKTAKPYFVIIDEIEFLDKANISKWLQKPKEEKTAPITTNDYFKKLEAAKKSGVNIPSALLEKIRSMNVNLSGVNKAVQTLDRKEGSFSAADVTEAFKELYLNGNRKELYLLATTEKYTTVTRVILSMAQDGKNKAAMCDHAVYGSYEEMKNNLVNEQQPTSVAGCYVRPSAAQTRLYQYNTKDAESWWQELYRRLNERKQGENV